MIRKTIPTAILLAVLAGLAWSFHSGRLIWTGSSVRLAAFKQPASAPTTEVHPEVLNLQASFSRVAEMVKPAVVSISTVHMQKMPENQAYFGDPFEQFFEHFFGGNGGPAPGEAPF